ncbi:hypothetical protein FKP32DRAFT_318554 [Trametes sanguinea]|nr:hypothetical protein FKP32DRAFT_318554 [Trametes sanguinea]
MSFRADRMARRIRGERRSKTGSRFCTFSAVATHDISSHCTCPSRLWTILIGGLAEMSATAPRKGNGRTMARRFTTRRKRGIMPRASCGRRPARFRVCERARCFLSPSLHVSAAVF